MKNSSPEGLSAEERAEDILLGSLGYGEGARIKSIERTTGGYKGFGVFTDGDEFQFQNEEGLDELETWALDTLLSTKG